MMPTPIPRIGPSAIGPVQTAFFDFRRADDDAELLDNSFLVRYEVYCVERGFLTPDHYPDQRERDEFDETSVHFLGRHRQLHYPAGTARLIFHSHIGLPMMHHCRFDPQFEDWADPHNPALLRSAEVSRLAVSKRFRQRAGDSFYGGPPRHPQPVPVNAAPGEPAGEIPAAPLSNWPEIVAGLYKCIYQAARAARVNTLLVAMETGLYVLLRRMHIRFHPMGPEVDYYGPVRPYMLSIAASEDELATKVPSLLMCLVDGLPRDLWPQQALEMAEERVAATALAQGWR